MVRIAKNQPPIPYKIHPWYALKVRTRAEDRVLEGLLAKGYPSFLPTYVESRRYSDRIKTVKAALFPGYLFCRFDATRILPVLTTAGVEYVVGFGGVPQPLPDSEIEALEAIAQSGVSSQPWPFLRTGHRVRIQFGALTGVEGLLVRTQGSERLVLSVELLQRSISVEIDRSWVRPDAAQPQIDLAMIKPA